MLPRAIQSATDGAVSQWYTPEVKGTSLYLYPKNTDKFYIVVENRQGGLLVECRMGGLMSSYFAKNLAAYERICQLSAQ